MACFNTFTFTWTINNFRKYLVTSLKSPEFIANPLDQTKWSLSLLVPKGSWPMTGSVICTLQRERDYCEKEVEIDFMISIIGKLGVLHSVQEEKCYFGMNLANGGDNSFAVRKNLIDLKTLSNHLEKYVPDNTLTLRCRMSKYPSTNPRIDVCFARTVIDIEKRSFVWAIKDISSIFPGGKRTIKVPLPGKESSFLQLDFCLKKNYREEFFSIEMYEVKNLKDLYCSILTLDNEVNVIRDQSNNFINIKFVDKKCILFQKFLNKGRMIFDKNLCLINDTLSLQCDFELSFGVHWNKIENYEEDLDIGAIIALLVTIFGVIYWKFFY